MMRNPTTEKAVSKRNLVQHIALAAVVLVVASGPGRAEPVLEFNASSSLDPIAGADTSSGWSFTTHQAITVVALDAYDATGDGANNVRLYDGSGHVLAQATVTNSNPTEGSPVLFHTVAITPVTLLANTTYYIAEDTINNTTKLYYNGTGLTTDPSITYNGSVIAIGTGQTPTSNPYFGTSKDPSEFGPNFDIRSGGAIPEPSTVVLTAIGGLIGLGYRWRRRKAKVSAGKEDGGNPSGSGR
jgi:hypothetical protein